MRSFFRIFQFLFLCVCRNVTGQWPWIPLFPVIPLSTPLSLAPATVFYFICSFCWWRHYCFCDTLDGWRKAIFSLIIYIFTSKNCGLFPFCFIVFFVWFTLWHVTVIQRCQINKQIATNSGDACWEILGFCLNFCFDFFSFGTHTQFQIFIEFIKNSIFCFFSIACQTALIKQYILNILKHKRSATETRAALPTTTAKGVIERKNNKTSEQATCVLPPRSFEWNWATNKTAARASNLEREERGREWGGKCRCMRGKRACCCYCCWVCIRICYCLLPKFVGHLKHWLILLLLWILGALSCYFPLDLISKIKILK